MWVAQRDGDYVRMRGLVGETLSFLYGRVSHIDFSNDNGWTFEFKVRDDNDDEDVVATASVTNDSTPDYVSLIVVISHTTTADWESGNTYYATLDATKSGLRYTLDEFILTPRDRLGD